jgi:alkanesulfonate monooxygenase SsuD/methylene tetrahydromethanopterin reductase-like flavin-dependent oxidoreductase (luciferase family)
MIANMQAALFGIVPYSGPVQQKGWPVAGAEYSSDVARASMERALDNFELADQIGFDWVSVAEHHYAPGSLTPNPMVMAAALSQRVKRAKIAVLGSNIPIQNPVRVAEEFAMLDTLTGGRLIAGMLRGTSNEYVTYGVNPAESRERFVEALKLIVRAWTEPQPFGWLGRYYEYRTISIWPRPVQRPHPPIFMSISSPEMAEFAAANQISAGFAVTTVPLAKTSLEIYRAAAHQHGWDPMPENVLYRVGVHVTATDDEAWEDLTPPAGSVTRRAGGLSTANPAIDEAAARAGFYGRDVEHQRGRVYAAGDLKERVGAGRLLLGSPDRVLDQIAAIHRELGAGILEVTFAAPTPDKVRRDLELFGDEVLPRMREL